MKVLDYYPQFQCIGAECEDTCCVGWTVTIDKKTYKKYQSISDLAFRKKVLSKINRNKAQLNNEPYKIKLNSDSACPFLDQDRLCEIYKNCGESYLSNTCSSFPRHGRKFFDQVESTLSLGCPEAARLALLHEQPVQLIDIEPDSVHSQQLTKINLPSLTEHLPAEYQQPCESFRMLCLLAVQMRQFSLDQRLFMIGFFVNKFSERLQSNDFSGINQVIVDFIDCTQTPDQFLLQYQALPSDPNLKLKYFTEVLVSDFPVAKSPRLAECLNWFVEGFGLQRDAAIDLEPVLARYQSAYREYYEPFLQNRGVMLENYLVSHMFFSGFPFEGQFSPLDNYLKFISTFASIQTLLIGMAAYHKGIKDEHVVQLIQSYERFIAHNVHYLPGLVSYLKGCDFNTLPAMVVLIKP